MSRSKFFLPAIIIFAISLCSCSEQITIGEVVYKKYNPEYTTTMVIPVTISNGKTSTVAMIPYVYHYNESWEITIRGWDEEEQEFETATYRVTEEVFETTYIGGEFQYLQSMEPNIPEYTRERQ